MSDFEPLTPHYPPAPKPYKIEDFENAWFHCPFGSTAATCVGTFSYVEIYEHLDTVHDKPMEFTDGLFGRKRLPTLIPIPKKYWPHNAPFEGE